MGSGVLPSLGIIPSADADGTDLSALGLLLSDVPGPQGLKVANIQPSISNHRMGIRRVRIRPRLGGLRLIRRSEAALFPIPFRRCFNQPDISLPGMNI